MLLPHESTVAHEQRFKMDDPMISRTRSILPENSLQLKEQEVSDVQEPFTKMVCFNESTRLKCLLNCLYYLF